jgi:hypothetical protein
LTTRWLYTPKTVFSNSVLQQEVFVSKIEELSNKPSNVYSTAVVETIGLNIASTITSTLASTIKKRLRKE